MQMRLRSFRCVFNALALAAVGTVLLQTLSGAEAQTIVLFEYPGTSLRGVTSAEFRRPLDDCRKICTDLAGCAGFDFSSGTGTCRLFTSIASAAEDSASIAGSRNKIAGYKNPANDEAWYFARFTGVDFWGGDLSSKGVEVPDAASCEKSCDDDHRCHAFTFNPERNRCFLKNSYDFVQAFDGGIAGIYFKARSSNPNMSLVTSWKLYIDSYVPGNDLSDSGSPNYKSCMDSCDANSQCAGFTWVSHAKLGHCYLKTGANILPVQSARKNMATAIKVRQSMMPDIVRPASLRE